MTPSAGSIWFNKRNGTFRSGPIWLPLFKQLKMSHVENRLTSCTYALLLSMGSSVTTWLYYFSIIGDLYGWKFAQLHTFAKIGSQLYQTLKNAKDYSKSRPSYLDTFLGSLECSAQECDSSLSPFLFANSNILNFFDFWSIHKTKKRPQW